MSVLALLKVAIQIYIQLRPRITPPGVGFILHSTARQHYRNFERTLRPLALQDGLRVVEVGGGTGAFTVPLAASVGPSGSVYSVELQAGMLQQQRRRVEASGTGNVRLYRADALALPFVADAFDRAVLIACLPMLPDKQQALRELRRVLRPGGLVLVSEELVEPEYVPLAVARRWCLRAGLETIVEDRQMLFYTLVFHNPAHE